MDVLQNLARTPVLGRILLAAYRFRLGLGYLLPAVGKLVAWTFRSREVFNYTYELEPRNREYLAAFLANATGASHDQVVAYFTELEMDVPLAEHIRQGVSLSREKFIADATPRYGRRIGWYALTRILKPRLVVETGVDKGLGACVLCAALLRNRDEGSPGRYVGTEINPRCGYLLSDRYAEVGEIVYGDSIQTLERIAGDVDLFINDSDHSEEYEGKEYSVIEPRLGSRGVVIGDNSHVTSRLIDFCKKTGRSFSYFQEKPDAHWYPGSGIGLAWPAKPKSILPGG